VKETTDTEREAEGKLPGVKRLPGIFAAGLVKIEPPLPLARQRAKTATLCRIAVRKK